MEPKPTTPDEQTCRYAREQPVSAPSPDDGATDRLEVPYCELKQHDDASRTRVYEALARLGLEPSVPNELCPVAVRGEWSRCPFYEPQVA